MIAYKGFDKNMQCRGFQYKIGETYEILENPIVCERGFHFCKDLILCLEYYANDGEKIFCEVEILGDVDFELPTKHKGATNKIKIVKIINLADILTGNKNSGDNNSGYNNSGNYNSGYKNSGDNNSGNKNSGNWNKSDSNNGFFNSKDVDMINVFNKPCSKKAWESASKPRFLFFDSVNGKTYKESFQESFKSATVKEIDQLKNLPNFDVDVFFEISGIRII